MLGSPSFAAKSFPKYRRLSAPTIFRLSTPTIFENFEAELAGSGTFALSVRGTVWASVEEDCKANLAVLGLRAQRAKLLSSIPDLMTSRIGILRLLQAPDLSDAL